MFPEEELPMFQEALKQELGDQQPATEELPMFRLTGGTEEGAWRPAA